MGAETGIFEPLERIARGAGSALLTPVRQAESLFTAGSLENARSSVVEAARRRAIKDALDEGGGPDLSRSA